MMSSKEKESPLAVLYVLKRVCPLHNVGKKHKLSSNAASELMGQSFPGKRNKDSSHSLVGPGNPAEQ